MSDSAQHENIGEPAAFAWFRGWWYRIKNVWVSVQTVILDGVTIGDDSVVGACTLVKEDVPEGVFVAGNPMRVIKSIDS